MNAPLPPSPPPFAATHPTRMLGWRRLRVVLLAALLVSAPVSTMWTGGYGLLLLRLVLTGTLLALVFGLFERWPAALPDRLPRWVLQLLGVALAVPLAVGLAYLLTSAGYEDSFWQNARRRNGFLTILGFTVLVAPWVAMVALLRHVSGEARHRALAFALERSQLERQALDARLHLLQAQVEPHFLFNTLANVRELVDAGSPQAGVVLGSLIAYLRAAVPRLHGAPSTMAQELDLVRAYLEVMQMRIPDRLQFAVHADAGALPVPVPPMALLTLVENAVRHGIDPCEAGGRIDVDVTLRDGTCHVQVLDTGAGLRAGADGGSGTGLANLRERMALAYGERAQLRLQALVPRGTRAELAFPAEGART
jgi:hypothetical protein